MCCFHTRRAPTFRSTVNEAKVPADLKVNHWTSFRSSRKHTSLAVHITALSVRPWIQVSVINLAFKWGSLTSSVWLRQQERAQVKGWKTQALITKFESTADLVPSSTHIDTTSISIRSMIYDQNTFYGSSPGEKSIADESTCGTWKVKILSNIHV